MHTDIMCQNPGLDRFFGTYVTATGDGDDLPPKCIFDQTIKGAAVRYWNPNGTVISNDENIRQVCSGRIKTYG